jgi:3-deoxy-D-manno-octulosonic-acid transferase
MLISDICRAVVEEPLYSAGIILYRVGVSVAGVCNVKARRLAAGQRRIWRKLKASFTPGDKVFWIHAASLGEFEQGRPLIEMVRREHPEYKILLTFYSPSGYEVRKDWSGADCVCYLPFDTPLRVSRFMRLAHPEIAVFVKYEIWRNYLHRLYRRHVPVYLMSAAFRPDQWFFRKESAWYGQWLRWFTRIFVQTEESRHLLERIGITQVDVAGDTRFDRVSEIRDDDREVPELERFARLCNPEQLPVMLAGSSWPQDEEIYAPWFNAHPDIPLIIAPHEFDAERIEGIRRRFSNGVVLLSEMECDPDAASGCQVLVMDCMGLLSSAYRYCDIAYVGGGFGAGIHNLNEAAVYGVPVIFGPNHTRFVEALDLAALGGGIAIAGREGFEHWMGLLVCNSEERLRRGRWAAEYISEKQGATERIYNSIFRQICPSME